METGLETIIKERTEQIEKHGFDLVHDNRMNTPEDLENAATYALTLDAQYYPEHWEDWMKDRLHDKDFKERVGIAGAWCAAAITLKKYIKENQVTAG